MGVGMLGTLHSVTIISVRIDTMDMEQSMSVEGVEEAPLMRENEGGTKNRHHRCRWSLPKSIPILILKLLATILRRLGKTSSCTIRIQLEMSVMKGESPVGRHSMNNPKDLGPVIQTSATEQTMWLVMTMRPMWQYKKEEHDHLGNEGKQDSIRGLDHHVDEAMEH